jgi:ABC-type multidrug transport system ATPase subunit
VTHSSKNKDQQTNGLTITVKDLSKRFNREWIFRNFNFEFSSENIYAITGPNGSGKSTLLQILWGQVPQTSGTFEYQANDKKIEMEDVYKHVSIAAPYMDLIEEFTLAEHLDFHFKLKKIRNNLTIDELMTLANLEGAGEKFIGNFSSGLKQRIKLCLAFYTEADVLFLDEPTTNLDHKNFNWYQEHLKKIASQAMVVIASNDPEEYPSTSVIIDLQKLKT